MAIQIVALTYGKLTEFIQNACTRLPEDVQVRILDGVLYEVDPETKYLVQQADVVLSSGLNAKNSFWALPKPCVSVVATGFDLMQALERAMRHTDRVVVLTFEETIPEISATAHIFKMRLEERVYSGLEELENTLRELKREGVMDVVGTSNVVEHAQKHGMRGYLIYTERSVETALHTAIIIAQSKKKEQEDTRWLNSILEVTTEAVVAIDRQGIVTLCNQCAENLLGKPRDAVCGHPAEEVIPTLEISHALVAKRARRNRIQTLNNAKVLVNSIPIENDNEVIGALGTFQSVEVIERAEARIRSKLYTKGFVAKICFNDLLGESPQIQSAKEQARLFALSDSTVLITGESGCGKDLFAQSIHNASDRKQKPYVAVNCAAFPAGLLESELFGYEEGAFTGARKGGRRGVFELAHGGTILLDEIGEISLEIQARLLRVLEQKEILRVGGERITPVDIRILAATNKNLWEMVQDSKFRSDLYYRLNVLRLNLPALKERPEDIPLLLRHFLDVYCGGMSAREIDEAVSDPVLTQYSWPGNVREVKNVAERFAALNKQGSKYRVHIGEMVSAQATAQAPTQPFRAEGAQDRALLQALQECRGNRSQAAQRLGICRTTLWRRLREIQAKA